MKNKIFFIIFIIIWGVLIIGNFILPKEKFSEQENRYLASMPKFNFDDLVSGVYSEKMDNYINDNFILRSSWVRIKTVMELAQGKKENNNVFIGKDGYLFEKFSYQDTEKQNLQAIAQNVNSWTEKVEVPVSFILVPNSIYINADKLPDNATVYNQKEIINEYYSYLNNKVQKIDVVPILEKFKKYDLYFKTDHHMTTEGSYLVYVDYCMKTGQKPVLLSELERVEVTNKFLGTFDSKAQIPNQKTDRITIYKNEYNTNLRQVYSDGQEKGSLYNEEYLNKKDKYSYFLDGNKAQTIVKTNVNNGKKIMVIKDSYAHNMMPFFCQNYEEIHYIDPRYYLYPLSDYVAENGITEVLFLYNVTTLLNDMGLKIIK